MKKPEISIIIPVYRVQTLIERSVSSVISQTLKEFELVLVDDCGGDNSIELAEALLRNSWLKNSYKVVKNTVNSGVAASRGAGLDASSGNYIIHLDSDDYFDPVLIQTLYFELTDTGSDLAICGYYAEERNSSVSHITCKAERVILQSEEERGAYIKDMLANRLPSALWNKMARRELFMDSDIKFIPELRDDLSVSPLLIAKANKIVLVNKPLVHYVLYNSSSVSATSGHLKLIISTIDYLDSKLPAFAKNACREEIFSYKVKTRRRLFLHKEIDKSELVKVITLFPEINREVLIGNNPETKAHYRILSSLISRGDSSLLRLMRGIFKLIIP